MTLKNITEHSISIANFNGFNVNLKYIPYTSFHHRHRSKCRNLIQYRSNNGNWDNFSLLSIACWLLFFYLLKEQKIHKHNYLIINLRIKRSIYIQLVTPHIYMDTKVYSQSLCFFFSCKSNLILRNVQKKEKKKYHEQEQCHIGNNRIS